MDMLTDDKKMFLASQRNSSHRGFIPMSSLSQESLGNSTETCSSDYREIEDENTNDAISTETLCSTSDPSPEKIQETTGETNEDQQGIFEFLNSYLTY